MAEAVVSFGIEKLWELVSRESELLHGVHEQVAELKHQWERLQALLRDAYAKKHESERVRNFLEDVKDIFYDAEDIIETFLIKERQGKEKGMRKLAFIFSWHRRKMASDIKSITKRISQVIEEMQIFGILQIIDDGPSTTLEDIQREIRQTYRNKSESDILGLEHSVEELVGHLVGNDNIQVVSISGMGGIGKTTLARQVFHHDLVQRHFDGFAWICVSQQFTQTHVWQRMLQDLRPDDEDILLMDQYKRQGWKVLLTSRNEGVGFHADPKCFSFRPRTLTPELSWTLFQRITFPWEGEPEFMVDEERVAMGKEMVAHCGGLPLAIKVLGGLLATKHTVPQWRRVYEDIGPHIVGGYGLDDNNRNLVYRVLSLSYEDLPMELKHCFLYLAHFPLTCDINVETLFYYWAAEGLIKMSYYDRANIQDNAESYLEELVRSNMVIAERSISTSRYESCHMHDIMKEFCLSKAKDENFLQIVKVSSSTSTINAKFPSRYRRLAIHSGNAFELLRHDENEKVRSLLFFMAKEETWIQSTTRLGNLPFLRMLDLSRAKFQGGKLPSSIGKLIHLRFLSLYRARVSHIHSSLRNLKLMLYLNLDVDGGSVHVPNVLKEMRELRYLFLPSLMDDKTKLELGDLVNLETLNGYSSENTSVSDLLGMTKLRTLIVHSLDGCTLETLSSSLCQLRELEQISLYEVMQDGNGEGKCVLDFIHLKSLVLAMHMPKFPDLLAPNLSNICLRYCRMEEDPMPILEKLHHLTLVEISYCAFTGKRMVCSSAGFPQLCVLHLNGQEEMEEWIVEEGSMRCLHTLTITASTKLKELPDGLKHITSLKELTVVGKTAEWKERVVPGGEDYYKVQHIPNVQHRYR